MDNKDSLQVEALAVLDGVAARSGAQMSAENFPVALRLLPREPRDALARVYRFARFVDDVGDEAPGDPVRRLELLDLIATELRTLETGGPVRVAAVSELREPVASGQMSVGPLLDLVEANRLDQAVHSYETFDDLLGYCRYSAAPVGRLVLQLAGAATEENEADSDAVCAGLQVLEHCQDVAEDARMGRVYLPQADLRAAGVDPETLSAGPTPPGVRRVVATQVARSHHLLEPGRALARRLHGWARAAVAGYVAGGMATADALVRADYDVLARSVRPSRVRTAMHGARLLGPQWGRRAHGGSVP